MPHEGLSVFHISANYLKPGSERTPEHLPVHPTDTQRPRSWLNVTNKDVVIPDTRR